MAKRTALFRMGSCKQYSLKSVVARLDGASGLRVRGQTTEDELALLLVLGESLLGLRLAPPRIRAAGKSRNQSDQESWAEEEGCWLHAQSITRP